MALYLNQYVASLPLRQYSGTSFKAITATK